MVRAEIVLRAILCWAASWGVGVLAYLIANRVYYGAIGRDWRAAPVWAGICLAVTLPLVLALTPWLARTSRSVGLRVLRILLFAALSVVPSGLFALIWSGFGLFPFHSIFIALIFVVACASFPELFALSSALVGRRTAR